MHTDRSPVNRFTVRCFTSSGLVCIFSDSRKRSPRRGGNNAGTGVAVGSGGGTGNDSEPPSTELVGEEAEARGLWLTALKATVSTVRCASRFVPAFVQDFESAGGYETVGYMVRRSSIERLPAMLEQVRFCREG